jgi:hypothetical protein
MKQKVFCDVELLKIVFFKNKMSLGYIGYFQDMISFISREKTVVIFEGYISIKHFAKSLNVHPQTIRRFFNYCEGRNTIISRSKDKYLDDDYYISINTEYCKCFIIC